MHLNDASPRTLRSPPCAGPASGRMEKEGCQDVMSLMAGGVPGGAGLEAAPWKEAEGAGEAPPFYLLRASVF